LQTPVILGGSSGVSDIKSRDISTRCWFASWCWFSFLTTDIVALKCPSSLKKHVFSLSKTRYQTTNYPIDIPHQMHKLKLLCIIYRT
jgi:hypothetical protein